MHLAIRENDPNRPLNGVGSIMTFGQCELSSKLMNQLRKRETQSKMISQTCRSQPEDKHPDVCGHRVGHVFSIGPGLSLIHSGMITCVNVLKCFILTAALRKCFHRVGHLLANQG